MNTTPRRAVVILGMHRSGTSALAGIAHLLGAAAPAGMMKAAFDNPTGFFESFPITALNEAIFTVSGHHWYDALTFDSAAIGAAKRADLIAHCASVLAQEYGDAPLFVLKDPRMSLLFDVWQPVLAAGGIAISPILALRHPTEATSSMRRRDSMPLEIAAPMWLHYTLQAERLSRGMRRALLSYDHLLQDWKAALTRAGTEAGIDWPNPPAQAAPRIKAYLRPQMRHHHAAPSRVTLSRPPLSGWITETYDALRRLEAGEEAAQYQRLDNVHAAFAAWRATAPRISLAAATGQEPLTISSTPACCSAAST